jgi:hypothetical protein
MLTKSVDFVIPAAGGQVSILGMYTLSFPANSVCVPDAAETTAGYASQSWDADCPAATQDIAVTAKLKWSSGRLWVDFSPAIRFVPSQTVTIQTDILAPLVRYYGASALSNGMARRWGINYTSGIEGPSVDESRTDASLRTVINGSTGRISRRIKHFSGYQIYTGDGWEACIPIGPLDPYCIWVEDPIWNG